MMGTWAREVTTGAEEKNRWGILLLEINSTYDQLDMGGKREEGMSHEKKTESFNKQWLPKSYILGTLLKTRDIVEWDKHHPCT